MLTSIRLISADEALPLRQRILRPGSPLEKARYPEDQDPTTFHVGLFRADEMACVATFLKEAHPEFSFPQKSFRLRGMATDTLLQGQGLGREVVTFGIERVRQNGGSFLWCNARQSAFPFYLRLGFQLYGELFDIAGIGPHKVMYKEIAVR